MYPYIVYYSKKQKSKKAKKQKNGKYNSANK
jgi:hypothetical protein